jgi:hypothetical protein
MRRLWQDGITSGPGRFTSIDQIQERSSPSRGYCAARAAKTGVILRRLRWVHFVSHKIAHKEQERPMDIDFLAL